jgi:5-methylcytosine-specific restriction endonuclease McrA
MMSLPRKLRENRMIIPNEIWQQVFDRANGYCEYCDQDLLISRATYASAQVDHVLARAKDGRNNLENLRLACSQCNSSLSRYNHLTTFEERKDLVAKKIEEYHQRNYQEKLSKLRGSTGASSA